MTTIAWDKDEIATDSQCTQGSTKMISGGPKIKKVDDEIIAYVGAMTISEILFDWYIGGQETSLDDMLGGLSDNMDDMDAGLIIFKPDGKVFELTSVNRFMLQIKERFWSIGSGSQFAIGAMAAGVTAAEAVRIASKYDIYTGGRVHRISRGRTK